DVSLVPESAQPVSPSRAALPRPPPPPTRLRRVRRGDPRVPHALHRSGGARPLHAPPAARGRARSRDQAPHRCRAAPRTTPSRPPALRAVPLPPALEYAPCTVIHCTLTPPERRRSGRGAVSHSGPTSATTAVQGVRVSGPLDLLVQLAEQLEHDDLVAAADQLVGPDARVRPRPRLEHLRDRAR